MNVQRFVTLRSATLKHRIAQRDGRDHVVVPVVALVEGVIHPVNAPHAELVKAERFASSLAEWEGQPIFAGHPMKDGIPVDGHLEDILPLSFGFVANAKATNKQLTMEAWIDPDRAATSDAGKRILERATHDTPDVIEVSVGVFVTMQDAEGEFNGRKYKGEWLAIKPNHLALLSERQVGACSIEMGCGALRAAEHCGCQDYEQPSMKLNADGSFEVLGDVMGHEFHGNQHASGGGRAAMDDHNAARANHEAAAAMHTAAAKFYRGTAKSSDTTDLTKKAAQMSKEAHAASTKTKTKPFASEAGHASAMLAKRSSGADSRAGYHEQAASQHANAAYFHSDAHTFMERASRLKAAERSPISRLLQFVMPRYAELPADISARDMELDLTEALRVVEVGATSVYVANWYSDRVIYSMSNATNTIAYDDYYVRNYTLDEKGDVVLDPVRQSVDRVATWEVATDELVTASDISEGVPQLKAACGCGGPVDACKCSGHNTSTSAVKGDTNMDRKAVIAALVANPHNFVKSAEALEKLTDAELTGLEGQLKTAADKAATDATTLKAAQDALVEAKKPKTDEQYLAEAPEAIRTLVTEKLAHDAAEKDTLVGALKVAQTAFDETALKAMPMDQLRKFGEALKINTRTNIVDFSLRGVPMQRVAEGEFDGSMPDAYATAAK